MSLIEFSTSGSEAIDLDADVFIGATHTAVDENGKELELRSLNFDRKL